MRRATISAARRFPWQNWIRAVAAFGSLRAGSLALAQTAAATAAPDNASAKAPLNMPPLALTLGPLNLHPRVTAGMEANDNLLFTSANKESDFAWTLQPGLQAVIGDDAALINARDQGGDALGLTPGSLIVEPPEAWTGKIFMLDYAPRFEFYDKYTAYNALDQFVILDLLWPMDKLILGFRQDYQLEKATIIEANQFATTETIDTTLSAAYQLGDKTSVEGNFRRIGISYDHPGLIGYTEYNTEDWFNYELSESMPVSLGVLAGYDDVAANNQNQTYEQLRARMRYNFTEKLVFDASAGGELRQFENGMSGNAFTPVFTLTGTYRPTERTSVSLTGYQQQNASIFNGYNYSSTGANLAFSQGITDRFTAGASIGFYTLNYKAVTSALANYSDDYYTAGINLQVKIVRHLNGQISYNLASRQSPVNGEAIENQIDVNLTFSY
jgi:hypothetical protein